MVKAYLSASRDAKECADRRERFAMVSAGWSRSWRACFCLALWSIAACAWSSIEKGSKWKSKWLTVEATAYCGGPCKICRTTGTTYTGRDASLDGIAVDQEVISLGSRIDLPGNLKLGPNGNGSWVLCDDTGVFGNAIDIRMKSHEEAKKWGRKSIRVRVWYR